MSGGFGMQDIIIASSALVVMIMFMVYGMSQKQARLRKRIARIKARRHTGPKLLSGALDALSLRRKKDQKVSPLVALLMKPLPKVEVLGARLRRAGYTIDARQFLLRCILGMLIVSVLALHFQQPFYVGLCAGFMSCVWLPIKIVSFKITSQQAKFLKIFPDAIHLIVRGLRSGLPVSESINLVVTEIPEPVAGVFQHVSNTMKLGISMEQALQDIAKKLDYTEFNFFVTSIILQRETGGNLSEILNNLAEVLRKRLMLRMKIHAMTSEARASSAIIGALPFVVLTAVLILSPDYIKPLYSDVRGHKAAAGAVFLLVFGMWSMRRMAKFEI